MTSPKNAIVVGGSLGGLFAGIVLKRLGYKVTILERSPTPLLHDQGAGIVVGGETMAFIYHFEKTNRALGIKIPLRHYLNRSGDEIHRQEHSQRMTSWDLLYHTLRANFDNVTSAYVQAADDPGDVSYAYGCTVIGIEEDEDRQQMIVTYDTQESRGEKMTAPRVFAADGPSSTIRKLLLPNVERTYAGYVAWRGTVPESQVSERSRETFVDKFTFFHAAGLQILAYVIPGKNGSVDVGSRYINWVWYRNYEDKDSVMTDASGKIHTWTNQNPSPTQLNEIHTFAQDVLPPEFAELVSLTEYPFIQAITDVQSPQTVFCDGKVILMGDAVAGFRPHTAGSTSQAAFHALLLFEYLQKDKQDWKAFEREVKRYADNGVKHGIELGKRSQFAKHPLAG